MAECEFMKISGKRCRAPAITGSKFCFFHDPSRAEQRKQAQSAGGLASSEGRSRWEWEPVEPLNLHRARGLAELVIEQLNEMRGLQPSPRKGTAIFYGVSLLVRIYLEVRLWSLRP